MKTIRNSRLLGGLLGIAVTAIALTASATAVTSSPTNVQYYNSSATLVVMTGGVLYYAQVSPTSACSANAVTTDTLKAWLSLSQAALLSGKTVTITYNVCAGSNYIAVLQLNQ